MSETFRLSDYQIFIGKEDIIEQKVYSIRGDDSESSENQDKAKIALKDVLKEMRVRIGTILKTDNVSFLIGAGASLSAGGVSLANIPKPLEKMLLNKAKEEQQEEVPDWIALFYEITSVLAKDDLSFDRRYELFQSSQNNDIPVIELNLEDFLNHLQTWFAGMLEETEKLKLIGASEITIVKNDLGRLIKEITGSLTVLLNLPKSPGEFSLESSEIH